MSLFFNQLLNAITLGAVYALLAISLTFIYSVSRVVQIAQGDVMTAGAYAGIFASRLIPNLAFAVLAGTLLTAVLGLLFYELIFRWLGGPGHVALVAGIALSLLMQEVMRVWFYQGQAVAYDRDVAGTGYLTWPIRLVILGSAAVLGLAFHLFLHRTQLGRGLRAASDNVAVTRTLGVSTARMIRLSFVIGSALAGGAGALLVVIFHYVNPTIGANLEFAAIAAVLVGGLGSISGAVFGSAVVALGQTYATTYLSSTYSDAITFGLMVLVIVARPQGIAGRSAEVRA